MEARNIHRAYRLSTAKKMCVCVDYNKRAENKNAWKNVPDHLYDRLSPFLPADQYDPECLHENISRLALRYFMQKDYVWYGW